MPWLEMAKTVRPCCVAQKHWKRAGLRNCAEENGGSSSLSGLIMRVQGSVWQGPGQPAPAPGPGCWG